MKIAEALMVRADLQKRIAQIKNRLGDSLHVQEGEKPVEDVFALIEELNTDYQKLECLIQKINATNVSTLISEEKTLSDVLVTRDILLQRRTTFASLIEKASVRVDRYSLTEIKFLLTIDVSGLHKTADILAKQYRELDTKIQEMNWKIDLLD